MSISKISIDKQSNDQKIDPYLQQQQMILTKLIDTLINVLSVKNILSLLPRITYEANITTFWFLASQFQQQKQRRSQCFLKLAKIYFQMDVTHEIYNQFRKCQAMLKIVPKIVKFIDALCHMRANLDQQKNIHQTNRLCLKVISDLENYKQEQFYQIFKWILESTKYIIMHAKRKLLLDVESIQKNNFLKYLKFTRKVVQQQKIQLQQAIEVYQQLMVFSIQAEDNMLTYLQLELNKMLRKKQGLNINKQLMKKSKEVSHRKLVKYMNKQWDTTVTTTSISQSTNCSSLFLKQNQSIIEYHKPIVRRKLSIKNSTTFSKTQSLLRMRSFYSEKKHSFKREGILEMRRSMLKKIRDNFNENAVDKKNYYDMSKKKKCVYNCIRNTVLKQIVISNDSLIQEMNCLEYQRYAFPVITLEEIMLKFQEKKTVRANSLQLFDLNSDKKSILVGKSLTFVQIFGSDIFHIKMYGIKQQGVSKLGFQIKQPPYQQHRMKFKNSQYTVTFDQLKSYVITSDLYFQLFQEKISSPFEKNDVDFVQQFCKEMSISLGPYQAVYMIYVMRMISCLVYWYYAPTFKLNGTIVSHRQSSKITDSLKFAIALQFLRNNNTMACFNHLKTIRNKSGNIECFQYLSYGRQILIKNIIKDLSQEKYYLCVVWLKSKTYRSFKIQQNALPYFKNIQVDKIIIQIQTGTIHKSGKLDLHSFMSNEECTIVLLQNIIETGIDKRYKKKLIKKVYQGQKNYLKEIHTQRFSDYSVNIIEQQKQQDGHLKKQVKQQAHIQINQKLQQFLSILKCFGDVYSCSYNFRIIKIQKKIIKLHLKYYQQIKYILQGGIKLVIFNSMEKSHLCNSLIYLQKPQIQQNSEENYVKIQTQFHDIIGIPIQDNSELYRVNRIHKNIKQEYYRQDFDIICKKLLKITKQYLYLAVGYQRDLHCWKITIYKPKTQNNYIVIIPYEDIEEITILSNNLHQIEKVQTRSSLFYSYQRNKDDNLRFHRYIWLKQIKNLSLDEDMKYITLNNTKYLIFQLYGSLQYFSPTCKMKIELVEIQNKIFYFIYRNDMDKKLIYAEVEQNPYSYNLNAFADFICKDNKIKSYNDMFIRLYHRLGSSHTTEWALSVSGINILENFCYLY